MVQDLNFKLGAAEARIVAHVCGDGFLCKYKSKQSKKYLLVHPRKNIYRNLYEVGYCNTCSKLLDDFSNDLKKVYGLKAHLQKWNIVYIKAKWVFERIALLGGGDSRNWFVSDAIVNANNSIIAAWLKAFFDDEAHVDIQRSRICVNSVNKIGLLQVQQLLKKIGICGTKFYGPYYYKDFFSYRLTIFKNSLKEYELKVGFLHPKKIKDLKSILQLL